MESPTDADIAAAWAAHEVLLGRLVEEGRLTPDMAADLCSTQGKEAWLRVYQTECRTRQWWTDARRG